MKKIKSILVYVEKDAVGDAALNAAVALAARNDAQLEIACIVPEVPTYSTLLLGSELDVDALLMADRVSALEAAVESVRESGVVITTCVLKGKPSIELTRRVLSKGHDLVMKAARHDEAGGLFYGPLAAQLMRICPCPVWIVQPNQPDRLGRIVAAVDPHVEDIERTSLNVRVIELASSLAELHGAKLAVLHTWEAFGVDLLAKRISAAELQRYLLEHEQDARQRVADLVARVAGASRLVETNLSRGDAKTVIPEFVTARDVDLVIMGTVSRTGISGFFIGNTAEAVLRQLRCSMLTVKPTGFKSPVTATVSSS